uniref:EamA domain-containing protein n=1 Tax=Amphora coffeiformis TaxID=265554 RepID=A0A7S3L5U7_9STRA
MTAFNYYSKETWKTLVAMIVLGATRIVSVKLYYQFDCYTNSPLIILTLLYLLGQSLSLVVYSYNNGQRTATTTSIPDSNNDLELVMTHKDGFVKLPTTPTKPALTEPLSSSSSVFLNGEDLSSTVDHHPTLNESSSSFSWMKIIPHHRRHHVVEEPTEGRVALNYTTVVQDQEEPEVDDDDDSIHKAAGTTINGDGCPRPPLRRGGSRTGLTADSHSAVSWWVDAIPWYAKPVLPALFNLCNAMLRLASLVYMAASIAEVLISGLELVLSVWAARYIRKRTIATNRWIGVWIVTAGILLVGLADVYAASRQDRMVDRNSVMNAQFAAAPKNMTLDGTNSNMSNSSFTVTEDNQEEGQWIGILLIIGQSIASVLQDITEEIFMSESDFPPTLLLGMEGLIGFFIGSVVFIPLAHFWGQGNPWTVLLNNSTWKSAWFALYIIVLFTLTGMANISATAATSSMTRNVWKNIRTLLVWAIGLVLHYVVAVQMSWASVGEVWSLPSSLIVPLASVVMFIGIRVYYKDK